jgi:hypothetical protein
MIDLTTYCVKDSLACELTKTGLTLFSGLILAVVSFWLLNIYGKRREREHDNLEKQREAARARAEEARQQDIDLRNDFLKLYGDFFAVWKMWGASWSERSIDANRTKQLFDLACAAEGKMEAYLLRIAAERTITKREQAELGLFRQAYQQLREVIRSGQPLPYFSDKDPSYVAFKDLTILVANSIIVSEGSPSTDTAAAAFRELTDNKYERKWKVEIGEGKQTLTQILDFAEVHAPRPPDTASTTFA